MIRITVVGRERKNHRTAGTDDENVMILYKLWSHSPRYPYELDEVDFLKSIEKSVAFGNEYKYVKWRPGYDEGVAD